MVAFNANRLVCAAISEISLTICSIRPDRSDKMLTALSVRFVSSTAFPTRPTEAATREPISRAEVANLSVAAAISRTLFDVCSAKAVASLDTWPASSAVSDIDRAVSSMSLADVLRHCTNFPTLASNALINCTAAACLAALARAAICSCWIRRRAFSIAACLKISTALAIAPSSSRRLVLGISVSVLPDASSRMATVRVTIGPMTFRRILNSPRKPIKPAARTSRLWYQKCRRASSAIPSAAPPRR